MSIIIRKSCNLLRPFQEQSISLKTRILANTYFSDIKKHNEFQKVVEAWDTSIKKDKTSKAMKAYLDRAKNYDEFINQQKIAYNLGRRHLANMMGEDPATFTQKDAEAAIEYLFPSGLYDPKARPLMRPPEEIFPPRKDAEFDESGRPHHFLFYTAKPNYFQSLFDLTCNIKELEKYHDQLMRKNVELDESATLDMNGYFWLKQEELERMLIEKIMEKEYDYFIQTLERFASMPYSNKYEDFFNKFRKRLASSVKTFDIATPQYDEEGRSFVTTYECLRKSARGDVTVRSPGTGKFTINGKDITYFDELQSREQVLFPLIFTNMLNTVDIECNVEGGGYSGQAGALRWGIAWTLRSFVDLDMVEKMRLAGLLTRDRRLRERKKPGQPGARRQPTWKKR